MEKSLESNKAESLKYTYGSIGKNDAGPTKLKAVIIKILPIKAEILGFKNLSTIQPQIGAVTAYIAPFIIKTTPIEF